jgi:hypothetical protein
MKRIVGKLGLAVSAGLLLGAVQAAAVPITYTISGVGSGAFGGTNFEDDLVTITSTGDTGSIFPSFNPAIVGHFNRLTSISISVAGLGEGQLIFPALPFPTIAYAQNTLPNPSVMIFVLDANGDHKILLSTLGGGLQGYDLSTAADPIVGFGAFMPGTFNKFWYGYF